MLARSTWGTGRYPAPQLAQAILEQRKIEVRDIVTDAERRDRTVLNVDATLAAQEKAAELAERFADWAWEDPARAAALARTYNERFNSLVLRSYDDAALSLPGLALTFRPRPHQVAAVARMIHEPAVLLAHEVGAGKTAEMIMGVTELRRLGLVRKPAIVVPNHMLEQFAREWLQLYPQAQVLVAGQRGPAAGPAPRVRRPLRHRQLGRHRHVPVGVRAHPAQRPRAARLPGPRARPDAPVDRDRQERATASRSSGSKARCCAPRNGCTPSSTPPRTRASRSRRPGSTTSASTRRTGTRTCAPPRTSPTRRSTGRCGPPTWT